MIALYIIGGLLALIALVLSSPISVRFFFYREAPELVVRVWGVPKRVLPRPPKKHSEKKPIKKAKKQKKKTKDEKPSVFKELIDTLKEDGVGSILRMMGELSVILKQAVGGLFRSVTVTNLQLQMRVSGKDAAAAATNYGKVCAAFYPLYGVFRSGVRVKKQDVDIRPDFLEEGNAVLIDVTARISLWKLTGAALKVGWSLLRLYIQKETNETVDIKERTVKDNG